MPDTEVETVETEVKETKNDGDCSSPGEIAGNAVSAVVNNETVRSVASTIANSKVAQATVSTTKTVLSNVGDILTGGLLKTQEGPFVYGAPLAEDSLHPNIKALAVAERSLILSESFAVQDHKEEYCLVKGRKLHIVTQPKMYVYQKDKWVATLAKCEDENGETYYDVLRGETDEKIGSIRKTVEKKIGKDYYFGFHAANAEPDAEPVYKLEGDFLSRRFVMKNTDCEAVAKVTKQLISFAAFDHYVVRIAAGMDPILVICCMVVIDEELDEELKEKIACVLDKAAETMGYDLSMVNPFS